MAKRISKLTGKPVRKYTRRDPAVKTKKERAAKASVVRGGTRAGAGRKSSEVHFAQLNAKVDTSIAMMGILAEQIGVDPAKLKALVEKNWTAKTEQKIEQAAPALTTEQVAEKAAEPAPTAPAANAAPQPERRKPGRPRKIVTAAPPAAPAPAQPVAAPVAPVVPPVTQPVVSPPAPVFAPQVPGVPAPQSVSVAQPTWPLQQPQQVQPVQTAPAPQFIPAPVQQPVAPVTFSPPPPPPPVNPQFAVGVAPLNVQPVAPVTPAPQAPNGTNGTDFEAQFQQMQNQQK